MDRGIIIARSNSIPDTHGRLRTVTIADPPVNANWAIIVPTHTRWYLHSVRYSIDQPSDSIQPQTSLQLRTGATTLWIIPASAPFFESPEHYHWTTGGPDRSTYAPANHNSALPRHCLLVYPAILQSITKPDILYPWQISNIAVTVEQWIDG